MRKTFQIVVSPWKSSKMQKKVKRDRPTDRPTDRQTDIVTCWVACTRLKMPTRAKKKTKTNYMKFPTKIAKRRCLKIWLKHMSFHILNFHYLTRLLTPFATAIIVHSQYEFLIIYYFLICKTTLTKNHRRSGKWWDYGVENFLAITQLTHGLFRCVLASL